MRAERCWALFHEGRIDEATALARAWLQEAESAGAGLGLPALTLGRMLAKGLQHHDAATLLARAVRELGEDEQRELGVAWLELARSLERLGRFRESDIAWTQAQAAQEQAGDPEQLARTLCQRSLSVVHRGQHDASLALLEQAWHGPILRDGATALEANVLAHLADVKGRLGRIDEALADMERAVALVRATGRQDDLVWVQNTAGDVRRRAGDHVGAAAAYEEALAVAETHAPGRGIVVRFNRALLALQAGRFHEADPGDLDVPWREAFPVLVLLALAAARQRRSDVARHLYRAERLLEVQPLADVDLVGALTVAAERCEAAGWTGLALRCWRLLHGQAEGLDDQALLTRVRDAAERLGERGGRVLLGDHRLVGRLGAGAMGVVWRGRHVLEDREVAIKVLTGQGAGHAGIVSALRSEGRALARLRHPRIVQVLDVGTVDAVAAWTSGGALVAGSPYVVMSLARGTLDLQARVGRWPEARAVLTDVLQGLGHAHARGLLHLDVKPENLLVDAGGQALITDFGLAHALGGRSRRGVSGSPAYMAPEQIQRDRAPLSPATDLYAVGGLATVLAAGRPPFLYAEVRALFDAHLRELPPALHLGSDWPRGFEAWRQWLLAKDPTARPASAAEALAVLRALDAGDPGEALPDWRLPRVAAGEARVFAGLALIEHRTPPLEGRAGVLDTLWAALARVRESGRASAVCLTGPPGCGRSALGRALVWRLRELGVAEALVQGAGGAGPWGLRAALVEAGHGPRLVPSEDWSWAQATSALRDRLDAGPVVWVLDDLHRSPAWVAALTRWLPVIVGRPLLLVVTALDGAVEPALAELLAHLDAATLALEPLPQAALVRALAGFAPLAPALQQRVAEAAQGSPARAVALVRHHVQAGHLVPGPDGYDFDGDLLAGVALDPEGAWAAAVRRRLGSVDESTWQALEVLACWDGPVPLERARGRLEAAAGLLVRRGLATRQGSWLRLPVATRELLLARARTAGRLGRHHLGWAQVLRGSGEPGREGVHRLGGGQSAHALPLLVDAADTAVRSAELVAGARWLRLARQAAQEAGLGPEAPALLDLALVEIRQSLGSGDFQRGLIRGRRLVDALDPALDPARAAHAQVLLARLEHGDRDPHAGERHARIALVLARQHGLVDVHVEAAAQLFERMSIDGRLDECQALLGEAGRVLPAEGHPWARCLLHTTLARLALHLADYAEVVLQYQSLLAVPFAQGNPRFEAQAWLALGEVHRLRGDLDQALQAYDRAEAMLSDSGAAMAWLPRLNRVLVLIARGEHAEARAQAEQCWTTAVQLGLTGVLPPAAALAVRHRAGESDERAYREVLRELTEAARAGNASESDYADCMLAGAEAAVAAGRADRARQLWRLAAIVLRQLDRDEEARALEARIG